MALSCKMELIRFPTLLRIQYIAECDKGTELHLGGGEPTQRGTIGVGTPHNIARKNKSLN